MSQFTRRTFIRNTAILGAATALSARSWGQVAGAMTDLRVAVIGLNGRGGSSHVPSLKKIKGVRIVALCDPDTAMFDKVKNAKDRKSGAALDLVSPNVKTYTD